MAGLINFEDENEVKQFLDNLGVEYSYQCYRAKDPEGTNVRCPHFNGAELLGLFGQRGTILFNICIY